MSSVIAIVKSLVGQVFALSPDGMQRLLVEGDRLFSGEQVMTGADGRVTLELVDGRTLDLGRDSQWSQADLEPAAAPSIAQDAPSVAELQQAISAGDDPTQTLDATAAGPGGTAAGAGNGAAGGGSSYVILEATADQVQPSIGYPTLGLASSAESVEDTPATPLFQATTQPVTPVDVAPTTRDQTLATDEDTPLRGAVSAADDNGDALTYTLGDAPAHGTLVLNADGSFVYTPATNFNGGDRFTVTVDDGQGNSVVSTVVVEVAPINDAPVANPDSASTASATPVTIDVLRNDSDVDGDPLTVTGASAANGSVTVNPDGTLSYTPNDGFSGTDTITYGVADGQGGTAGSSVTVTVSAPVPPTPPANTPPEARPDSATTQQDRPVTVNVLANDRDPDGDTLTVTGASTSHGSVTVNPNGTLSYTPGSGFTGTDTITYGIADGHGGTASSTVTITVTAPAGPANAAPIATADNASTAIDTPVTVNVLANDRDPDGDTLSVTGARATHGSVTVNPNGTLSYTPASGFTGVDTVTYSIADGKGGTASSTVTITVDAAVPTNTAPVAVADSATTTEDTPVTVNVLGNDSDADSDPLTVTGASAANGSVTINPDGTLSYTPASGFTGVDTVTYSIADGKGGTASSTVTITVDAAAPTNTAPVAVADSATTTEGTPVTVNVLGNDSDADGDPLTVTGASAANGSVTINADGTLSYTPGSGFTGVDTVTYSIADGKGGTASSTVTITVDAAVPTNTAPVAVADSASTTEGTPVTVNVLGNDSDADGDPLTVTGASAANGSVTINPDGTLSYTPASGFTGVDTVTYSIADGKGGTASSTVTITVDAAVPTNTAPVAVADSASTTEGTPVTVNVLSNDSDADGDPLTVTGANAVNGSVTINADGTLSYTPGSGFTGVDTVTYSIADGKGGTASSTVTITVDGAVPANTAPVAVADSASTTEGTPVTVNVLGNDSDADGDPLTVTGTNAVNGSVTVNPDGTLSYTPASGFTGVDTVTYSIADGKGGTASSTVTIAVNADIPPVIGLGSGSVVEQTQPSVSGSLSATDVDNPALAFNPGTLSGAYGSLTLDAAGNWSYSLDSRADGLKQGEHAQDSLTVTLNDGSTTTVSIAITGTNNAPQLQAHSQTVDEDHSASGNLLGTATDVDHDTLSLVDFSVGGVTHAAGSVAVIAGVGSLSVAADGQYSFTPVGNWSGTLPTVTYSVSDGTTTAQSSLDIQVTPVADAPLLDLNNPPSHPVATGLALQTWTGLALGTGGSGAAPATLQSTIDHAGVPAGSGQLSNLANSNVSAGTASKISGLIHLEAGHTYSFSGVGDDSIRLVIGGTVVGQATWGANSGAFSGTFTPTTSGYYTLDLYHHNQNGPGNYDVNFKVDGGALRDLSTANAELFRSTADLAQEGIRLSALQGTGGQGYYREYAQNEGDEDTAIPLSGVQAALTDTDGSESLHLSIGDIPVGARLSDGIHSFTASAGNTRADLDGWSLDTLSITPPLDFTGHFDLDIGATAIEGANAASAETHLPLTVVVYPATATPVTPPSGQEGSVQEDVSLSASGAFNLGTAAFVAGTQNGTYGALSMGADGKWTYTLNNASPAVQALVDNQTETDAFTVRLNNGTSTTVTLHVQGQNDAAVISAATPGSDRGAVTEDAVLSASGTLAVSDPDAGQAGFVAQTLSDGNYGSLSIDASGHWTYTLNNASSAVQGLKGGESLSRELSVHSLDGTPHTLTVTLNGSNDAPLSANDSATTREDTPLVLTPATLLGNDSDPDGDRLSIASVQGASHGSVALVNGNVVFTPTADYNGPASFTYTATDGKGGTSTATVALTVEAVNDAPRVSDGSASGTEDSPLVFDWAQFNATDIDSDPSQLTLQIATLPRDGVLQYNSGNAWVNVSAGQTFGKADIDAGKLRFLPDANESGGPAFGTSGVGNLQGHYAGFDYQVGDGQLSSPAAHITLDIAPVADAPTLSLSAGSRALFSTSWESVSNSDSTSETVTGSTLEGWTLITTPDSLSGGKNVFEVWTSGDSQQNSAGNYVNVVTAAGNGSNALELNNASGTLAQTLGIERSLATQAGKVYDLSLDYAGRPGFSTAYTSIAVLVDGKQIASYASTSPNSGLAWQNLHFSFTGSGGNQTIRIVTNATQFNANGRGALIDDLNLTEYQGAIAGNAANGTLTQIALAAYLVSALRDADGSEALSLTFGNLPSGATLVSASHPSGYSVVDGAVTLDAADLPSARLQLDASYTGPLSLTVAAHATEANGLVADSPTQQLDLQVLPGGVTSASIISGGSAGQTLTGTDNADEIHGQNGNDILYGLKGEDALFGGGGNDTLYGGDGNDKLYGEAGSDTLYGGNGNDQLLGGAGNDFLFGEAGDDRLFGGPGNDQLTGGAGKDTFVWQAGDTGQDTIKDFTPGEDHIDLRDLLQGENDGNILDYLRVNTSTSTLEINSSGNFAHGAAADVTIKLETGGAPVDLSHYGATSAQIVNSLIAGADPTVKIDH